MKKYTLIIGMIFTFGTIATQSQDTIPNSNFEIWNTNTSPTYWSTVNNLLPFGFFACNQTTNSFEGTYALSMKTIDLDGMLVPAVATLGVVGMGFTEGGIPFTQRPESLKGYFKHPSGDDAVMLFVQFYNQGIEIGSGFWSTTDSVPEFTMFEAPITFASPLNPDTMNITMITDQNILGSNMIIDALQFEYPPVYVQEVQNNPIHIYPNPCYDYVSITTESNMSSVQLINMSGEVVFQDQITGNHNKINLQSLPKGLYVLKMNSARTRYTQKLIKK